MSTEDIKIVDPDNGPGTNYTSLSAWEAGEQKNLSTAQQIAVADCRCTGGTADTVEVTVSGWTTDETSYIKIWTDPELGYRHNGIYETGNKYRLSPTPPATVVASLRMSQDQMRVIGLQITAAANDRRCIFCDNVLGGSGNLFMGVEQCILKSDTTTYGTTGFHHQVAKAITLKNNISFGHNFTGGIGFNTGAGTPTYINCTACNDDTGFRHAGGTSVVINCLANDCTKVAFTGSFSSASNHNLSSQNNAPGSYSIQNTTLIFRDRGANDWHLTKLDTAALGAGVGFDQSSSVPLVDIDNQPRPSFRSDIGADELPKTSENISWFDPA